MPRGDPFTQFCQRISEADRTVAADLHLHSTASDGDFTPSQVVAYAAGAKLKAIALTDHDTCAGLAAAREAALQFPDSRRPETSGCCSRRRPRCWSASRQQRHHRRLV